MTAYRVEDKYIITKNKIEYLLMGLKNYMDVDANSVDSNYLIRSVYFDNMYDSCLHDVESGLNKREKFRIRTYNNSGQLIRLELKCKANSKTRKESILISMDEYNDIISGNYKVEADTPYLIKKFCIEYSIQRLRPVNIIEYERVALVEPRGNVRITFDTNIGYSKDISRFFEDNIFAIPVLRSGQHIMEVKYDEFIPRYIKAIINDGHFQRTSFSKYYFARRDIGEL